MTRPADPLEYLVAKASELYSLPAVAMEVLGLTNNPKIDVPALKRCIENDPALSTKVLRVVNSALFGLSREVSDLNQALSLLGTKPLKLLVLGFSLPERLFDGVAAEILGWYWRRTLTKAVAAREIAEMLRRQSGDEAFIGGLLQDLGMLLLIQELGEPYIEFLRKMRGREDDLASMETALLGFDHTTLTARLLAHWGIPQSLIDAVDGIGVPPASQSAAAAPSLAQIVRWAGLVALLVAEGNTDVLAELVPLAGQSPGLTREQLDRLVESLEEKVSQLADVFSLRLPEGRSCDDVLREAHLRLAQIAAEVAGDMVEQQAASRALEWRSEALEDEFRALSEAMSRVSTRAAGPMAGQASRLPPPAAPASCGPASMSQVSRPPLSAAQTSRLHRAAERAAPPPEAHRPRRIAGTPDSPDRLEGKPGSTVPDVSCRAVATEIDPGVAGRLEAAAAACRQSQSALTLLLVELHDTPRLLSRVGVEGLERLRRFLHTACGEVDLPEAACLPYGDYGFAVIVPGCERQAAVRLGNQIIDRVRRAASGRTSRGRGAIGVGVGAATLSVPPKNFCADDLMDGAQRCLYGSHASGGAVVKSIEIL